MAWVRLEDTMPEDEAVAGLSDAAFRLYVSAICYCARGLTNGRISTAQLSQIARNPKAIAELVNAGLMRVAGEAYRIPKYLTYNPSRAQVLKRRKDASERMKRARSVRANKRRSS